VTEVEANLPWLPSREAKVRVARYRGCTLEEAELFSCTSVTSPSINRVQSIANCEARSLKRDIIKDNTASPRHRVDAIRELRALGTCTRFYGALN
jgi:hypothetical protein